MNSKSVLADFQFLGNRVSKLVLDTRLIEEEKGRAEVTIDFDYKVNEVETKENKFLATLSLIIQVKAKIKNKILFRVELEMDGLFAGDAREISQEKFMNMLEMNGLVTLLHISRAYLLSVTSQSGIQPPVKIPMINVLKLREKKARQMQDEKIRNGITDD
ncbi:protein-export chaperone SecB [Desulfosporosinus metallidurans]|uniref:Preprotein translocase subunit SecB n=1 Tax=Desulfosporosinus metallidurans TaxID=1888891 RepID=A0A1Q8R0C1_9FIRM|nr:protein-export chaperone SecB [Desulfosporosinus metallidurans]OLN33078.1 hypothetical protein DSOL_0805 [Desulfosporosinus metallidurans]